jgi:hypothetical protein
MSGRPEERRHAPPLTLSHCLKAVTSSALGISGVYFALFPGVPMITREDTADSIKVLARPDGSFVVTNSRTGFSKAYEPVPHWAARRATREARCSSMFANSYNEPDSAYV